MDTFSQTLSKFFDLIDQIGLIVLARLAPWLLAVLLMWFTVWYIRRRVRAWRRRAMIAPVRAVETVAKAGLEAATYTKDAVVTAAVQAGTAMQTHAVPVAKRAGAVAAEGAAQGMNYAAAAIDSATPHAKVAMSATAQAARAGAAHVVTAVTAAVPVVTDAAHTALSGVKTGAVALGIMTKNADHEELADARASSMNGEKSTK